MEVASPSGRYIHACGLITVTAGLKRWSMKNRFIASLAVLALGLSGALSINALAQTTDEGPAPSDQPSAPMEIGQAGPTAQPDGEPMDAQPSDAQPTEAQPGGPTGEAPAQTDQGVARISLIHGDVSTQRGDSGDWSAATLNQLVMTGDKVSTGDNARAELQLDFANILRLGPNSKANIANLTKRNIQIQLGEGIANFAVSKDSESEPEIDTPNVAIHPAHHDGVFRVEVRPDGDTIVIVREGEAQIATPQGSTEVNAGEIATVRGDAESAQYKISSAPDRDDWDRWNSDRDHLIRNATSWHHPNRKYTGAPDLDAYGNWQKVPDYGDVWVPNEPDGWVPYRNGNWTYQPYYRSEEHTSELQSPMYLLLPYTTLFRSMVIGRKSPTTAMFGFPTSPMAGSRIATATGLISPTTDRKSTRLNSSHRCIYSCPTRRSSDLW